MKPILLLLFMVTCVSFLRAQHSLPDERQKKDISHLIDQYSRARENRDTVLLKNILTADVDQLVSTGEWRDGVAASVKGMQNSSAGRPGTRTLTVDKIKMLDPTTAIVDCRYEIQNPNGTARKMWSTFVVVSRKGTWRIAAIRNMLPAPQGG
ncbi:MAG TPA: SgcJ/EcaC family oxidoreductase [Chryseosolibacter sp.]